MIRFNNELCYSPYPPTEYAKLSRNGIPLGPAAPAVDRAIGMPIMKKHGMADLVNGGVYVWNLAWLLTPEFDALLDLDISDYSEESHYSAEQWAEIFAFASSFEKYLLGPPTAFLKHLQKMKLALPLGFSFGKAMERAMEAEGLNVAVEAANVVKVDFRNRA